MAKNNGEFELRGDRYRNSLTKRTKAKILWEINYNNHKGMHTFSMCKCGRQGYRGSTRACNLCLEEELKQLEKNE